MGNVSAWPRLRPRPIVVGSTRPSWAWTLLPYLLGTATGAALCTFIFVGRPPMPEPQGARAPAVVQQPVGKSLPMVQEATAASVAETPSPPMLRAPLPLSDGEVREIQIRLHKERLDPGPVDGIAGTRTSEAIMRYQARKGQPPSGVLDRELLEALRSDDDQAPH